MEQNSLNILSGLQSRIPSIRNVYNLLKLDTVSSASHNELSFLKEFNNPSIIIIIGLCTTCYIIERKSKSKFHVIEIAQEVTYYSTTLGKLFDDMKEKLKAKDFIPSPLVEKIAVVNSYKRKVDATLWYRVKNTLYTQDEDIIENYKDYNIKELKKGLDIVIEFLREIEYEEG